ncbi:diguanylate cyclase domain-containing protein [Kribbella amoyensis]|uniref:diguanylate cyclase domain-containing protein n=1 Tax=Kribbella amoyensis TaxID=996641 RepID=UPI0011A9BC2F|nr:diguanylate cyclase [Kribbella amoyensis]
MDELGQYQRAVAGMTAGTDLVLHTLAAAPTGVLVLLDLDAMGKVNRRYGDGTGDRLVAKIAGNVQKVAQGHGGNAAHLGGDQFVAVVPDPPDADTDADAVVRDLRRAVRRTRILVVAVTASAGVVRWRDNGHPAELLQAAAGDLHHAKSRTTPPTAPRRRAGELLRRVRIRAGRVVRWRR